MTTRTVGSYQAKTHLPELLNKVSKGERITITKHGVPVAMLVPAAAAGWTTLAPMTRDEAIEELKTFNKGRRLGRLSIRQMIEEGRR